MSSDKMKVRITEKTGIRHDGQFYEHDEVRVVPIKVGTYFCANGWAEDLDGNVPTGERDLTPKRIDPANLTIKTG